MVDMMTDGLWGTGWMGGYGGTWVPILLVAASCRGRGGHLATKEQVNRGTHQERVPAPRSKESLRCWFLTA